jgi:uncharacterized protein YndB with AHSA1/START domain
VATSQHTITVGRPIDEVFAALTEVTNTDRWFPVRVTERWTSPPPHGVGSTRSATVRMLGRDLENEAVVTAFDPPRIAALRGTTNAPFEVTLRFAPIEGGTRVDVDISILMGGLARPIGALVSRWYGGQWARGLVTFKRMMESGEL